MKSFANTQDILEWMHKLIEEYILEILGWIKKGKENLVADALSRVGHNASIATILHFSSYLMTEAIESWKADSKL